MSFSEWKEVAISDICEIIGGGTPKTKVSDYWDGDIPWLSVVDFNNNSRHVFETEKTITEMGLNNSSTKVLNPGDIIISARGTVGALAQLAIPMTFNQSCYGIRANNKSVNDFLYYAIKNIMSQIKANTHGSVFDTIIRSTFDNLKILLPNIPEQKDIAETLSCLDNKIEFNNRINKNLEEMAQAIFKSWFLDFEPFQNGEFEDRELGKIPKGWRVVDFEDVFNFQEGPGIRNWQYVIENGIKFINIRCIQNNDLQLNTANMISEEEANGKYAHFMLNEWDVVVSSSGTLGKFAIVRKEHLPLCLNTSVIRFTPKEKFEYFSFMLGYLTSSEFYDHLITKACGSVQANFGPMHLRQIKLLFPTEKVLEQYHDAVFPLIKKSIQIRSENQTLTTIRDTLLPKLMSGEIQVPIEEVH